MMLRPNNGTKRFSEAIFNLINSDKILAKLIREVGDCQLRRGENYFLSLLSAIISQQLSGSVANSIYKKLSEEFDGDLNLESVQNLSHDQFRKSGISFSKEDFIRKLSAKFVNEGDFLSDINVKSDSEALATLIELKGIGRWTAEMFMIFCLNRLDVLPINDAGFRKSVSIFYLGGRKATDEEIMNLAESWKPYRSIATWYLWRSIDSIPKGPIQRENSNP